MRSWEWHDGIYRAGRHRLRKSNIHPAQYQAFLASGNVTAFERDVLLVHWAAPDHCARTPVIGEALGQPMSAINSACGRIGRKVVEAFGVALPRKAQISHAVSWFQRHEDGYYYATMLGRLADALSELGWGKEAAQRFGPFWGAQAAKNPDYWEGRAREAAIVQRARNGRARDECIAHYGCACYVCGFDFKRVYGERGNGFIEVHHLELVSGVEAEHLVDPVQDLRPVCANCHRMLHRGGLIDVEDLRAIVGGS